MTKFQIKYTLEGINADDGVDLFEIAPILMYFGDLIRSANDILGYDQKINVNVKPFKEGSWITELVLQTHPVANLLNYFKGAEGADLKLLLDLLFYGVTPLAFVIRFTNGRIKNYQETTEGIKYTNEKGEELTVPFDVHTLIQSPIIQNHYYNAFIVPLDRFLNAGAVVINDKSDDGQEQRFTVDDKQAFAEYYGTALDDNFVNETTHSMSDIYLNPKRGSYSGKERAYSFVWGDTVFWPVTIEDEAFLERLKNGDIRLYSEDVLRVNFEIREKRNAANKVLNQYAITEVLEYTPYEKPHQLGLDDFNV